MIFTYCWIVCDRISSSGWSDGDAARIPSVRRSTGKTSKFTKNDFQADRAVFWWSGAAVRRRCFSGILFWTCCCSPRRSLAKLFVLYTKFKRWLITIRREFSTLNPGKVQSQTKVFYYFQWHLVLENKFYIYPQYGAQCGEPARQPKLATLFQLHAIAGDVINRERKVEQVYIYIYI